MFTILKMKKIKALFIDIDWTLYDHKNKTFDYKSIKSLNKLKRKGVKIFLVTTRTYHTAVQLGVFDEIIPDGYAMMNGGYIVVDGKEIYQYHFPLDILKDIVDITLKHNLTMELSTKNDRFLIKEKNEYVDLLFQTYKETMPPVFKFDNQDVITALLFAPKSYDDVLLKEYPKNINYYRYDDYGVDIIAKVHSKGEAVAMIMSYLSLDKDECMAFGDDLADISMFKEVKYSVAMGNAKEEAKNNAFYVTKTVWKHGIKKALRHFKLIFF